MPTGVAAFFIYKYYNIQSHCPHKQACITDPKQNGTLIYKIKVVHLNNKI